MLLKCMGVPQVFEGVLCPAITAEVAPDSPRAPEAFAATAEEAAAANEDDSADVRDDKPSVALRTAVGMLGVVLSGYAVSGGMGVFPCVVFDAEVF